MTQIIEKWHQQMRSKDKSALFDMLAEDAVFYSPVVHTPQAGRDQVMRYMEAAGQAFASGDFKYVREIIDTHAAVLEFTCTMDDIHINGIDIIAWNDEGKITEIKVLIRPLKAINKVWENMARQLEAARDSVSA